MREGRKWQQMDSKVKHYGNHGNRGDKCVSTVLFVVDGGGGVGGGGGGRCYREPASHR